MSAGLGKCSKIRHIVRLRQMLRRWRNKARMSAGRIPSDVPEGHVAICVGTSCRRFVVRATYLNHPVSRNCLCKQRRVRLYQPRPLAIPCDESVFEEVIRYFPSESGHSARFVNFEDFKGNCHVGIRSQLDLLTESRPLLHGFAGKTIWN
ncbi:auxin-responsive protein SAUR50-like [Herrania umbratica]|uniref:Auxin-responsive protein SAUR50-like n=1 Tax=Herrania umbratica TaxID=108875 RepID=A0A6J1ACW7_9ROSI|nr:auxin-responsive protein SAUR50-like [Herrania umbratica]